MLLVWGYLRNKFSVIREHHPKLPYHGRTPTGRLCRFLKKGLNSIMFKHPHSVEHESVH